MAKGQGKHQRPQRTSWWQNVVPDRWRKSAPDTPIDSVGPASQFAAAQVAFRLGNAAWADQANLPPMFTTGRVSSTLPPLQP